MSAELAWMEKASPGSSLLVVPVQREVDDDEKHGREKKDGKKKHEHEKRHGKGKHEHDKKKHEGKKHHVEKKRDHDKKRDIDDCPSERVVWKKGGHQKADWALLVTRRHSGSGLTVRHIDASCALAALGRQHDRDDDHE